MGVIRVKKLLALLLVMMMLPSTATERKWNLCQGSSKVMEAV